jgi:hypothetical protein
VEKMTREQVDMVMLNGVGFVGRLDFSPTQIIIDDIMTEYHLMCHRMELKWGCGRLLELAGQDMRDKWERQLDKLKNALIDEDVEKVRIMVEGACRGIIKIQEMVIQNGHLPFTPEFKEISIDGKKYIIADDDIQIEVIKNDYKRQADHYVTLKELCRIYQSSHNKVFDRPDYKPTEHHIGEFSESTLNF